MKMMVDGKSQDNMIFHFEEILIISLAKSTVTVQ